MSPGLLRANSVGANHGRFYLITYPRSASNLLIRILALDEQPNVLSRKGGGGYFFMPVTMLTTELGNQGTHVGEWTSEQRDRMMQSYQASFDELEAHLQAAESEGKTVLIKEHSSFMLEPTAQTKFLFGEGSVTESPWSVQLPSSYGPTLPRSSLNETVLPDEFLHTFKPTFLIRHPALIFPSLYRTFRDLEGQIGSSMKRTEAQLRLGMTLHWTRAQHDWYAQHLSKAEAGVDGDIAWPIVLDADDVITEPDVVVRFCEIVGLDPTKLRFSWAPTNPGDLTNLGDNAFSRRFLSTLSESNGVMSGKTAIGLDISVEAQKWREEFGEEEGEKMEGWVRAAMPDYEFLRAKRLRPRSRLSE